MKPLRLAAALTSAMAFSAPASAVYLNEDGVGQALIFPYYTVQPNATNPFNTYLTVVNHSSDAKALRVRFRESRNSREVGSFNLFLGPKDSWAGVVVPLAGSTASVSTTDRSCTNPELGSINGGPPSYNLMPTFYQGPNSDGNGDGLERAREGWVEVIEMATLTGTSAAAATIGSTGNPANCGALLGVATPAVAAPTGGLSGTLTLINVASGMDFTVNAEALAELGSRPFYRGPFDPYPDWSASEIDPVSVVIANGNVYRSVWDAPMHAVSATLMRSHLVGEYVLDEGTRSRTDMVVVFPTRHLYVTASAAIPPFTSPARWANVCPPRSPSESQFSEGPGERFEIFTYDRDLMGRTVFGDLDFGLPSPRMCAGASVISLSNGAAYQTSGTLGSLSRGFSVPSGPGLATSNVLPVPPGAQGGWMQVHSYKGATINSLAASTRTNIATGVTTPGPHVFAGLPMLGFTARTFENGTLTCGAGKCQGNYGGAFPLKYERAISPAN
jgi:hypothetical protein